VTAATIDYDDQVYFEDTEGDAYSVHDVRSAAPAHAGAGAGAYEDDSDDDPDTEDDVDEPEDLPPASSMVRPLRSWIARSLVAAVLLLAAYSAYVFIWGQSGPDNSPPAQMGLVSASPVVGPSTPKAPAQPEPKPKDPIAKMPVTEASALDKPLRMMAGGLLQEQREGGAAMVKRFTGQLVELEGICSGINKNDDGQSILLTGVGERPAISCRVSRELTPEEQKRFRAGVPLLVRGRYLKASTLRDCEVARVGLPADEQYKDKKIEITGAVSHVQRGNANTTRVTLTEEATESLLRVSFVFRRADEGQLAAVGMHQFVTIQGVCASCAGDLLEIHNCQLVWASALTPGVPRLPLDAFVRNYESCWRAEPLPAAEAPSLTAAELLDAYEKAPSTEKPFDRKTIEVSGYVLRRDAEDGVVVLAGDTEHKLQVNCRFTPVQLARLGPGKRLTVRGVCNGREENGIRVDNCVAPDALRLSAQKLSMDYCPWRIGVTLQYNVARYGRDHAVLRRTVTLKDGKDGPVGEVLTTFAGVLKKGKLLGEADSVHWFREDRIPSPPVRIRMRAGFLELSQPAETDSQPTWEPFFKVNAHVGDTWPGAGERADVHYQFVEFKEHQGRPAAVIVKTFLPKNQPFGVETFSTYVKGVGEVERVAFDVSQAQNQRFKAFEMRLVEDSVNVTLPSPKGSKAAPMAPRP
jgi:hypothetical protein